MTTTSGELIADELERFLRDLRSIGRAEPTRKGYAAVIKDLESFCVSQGAPPVVGSLSRTAIQEWLFAMEDRKLSAGTRRYRFAVARRFTRWLLEEEQIDADPMRRLRQPASVPSGQVPHDAPEPDEPCVLGLAGPDRSAADDGRDHGQPERITAGSVPGPCDAHVAEGPVRDLRRRGPEPCLRSRPPDWICPRVPLPHLRCLRAARTGRTPVRSLPGAPSISNARRKLVGSTTGVISPMVQRQPG